ncbi:unnamed protein product [Closterium sp. NIES-64]|nr:unnamed protein product [Closterium sp. NIES-64]
MAFKFLRELCSLAKLTKLAKAAEAVRVTWDEEGSAGRVRAVFGVWCESEGGRGEGDLPSAVGEENLTHCLELRDLKGRVGEGAGNGNKGERKGGHQGEEIVVGGQC